MQQIMAYRAYIYLSRTFAEARSHSGETGEKERLMTESCKIPEHSCVHTGVCYFIILQGTVLERHSIFFLALLLIPFHDSK